MSAVHLHRAHFEREASGDFLVRSPVEHGFDDVALSRRQAEKALFNRSAPFGRSPEGLTALDGGRRFFDERIGVRGFFKEVALYSFWILLNTLMDRIYWSTGQFVLGAVSGTVAIAVFSVAVRLEQMYMSFSTAISSVFLPKVTSMVANGEGDRAISDLFIRTGRIQYCVLALVLTGFIVFGKQFIALWAGPGYESAYAVSLIFFVPMTVPLIQNLGITILQAKGMMRFRSLMYVCVAAFSLVLQIVLSKRYGVEGCAWAIAAGLVLGQIIIMNIYYYKVQRIDIPRFWKEIFSMSLAPACLCVIACLIFKDMQLVSVWRLLAAILVYCAVYLPLFWFTAMNRYEKGLVREFFVKIFKIKS